MIEEPHYEISDVISSLIPRRAICVAHCNKIFYVCVHETCIKQQVEEEVEGGEHVDVESRVDDHKDSVVTVEEDIVWVSHQGLNRSKHVDPSFECGIVHDEFDCLVDFSNVVFAPVD